MPEFSFLDLAYLALCIFGCMILSTAFISFVLAVLERLWPYPAVRMGNADDIVIFGKRYPANDKEAQYFASLFLALIDQKGDTAVLGNYQQYMLRARTAIRRERAARSDRSELPTAAAATPAEGDAAPDVPAPLASTSASAPLPEAAADDSHNA